MARGALVGARRGRVLRDSRRGARALGDGRAREGRRVADHARERPGFRAVALAINLASREEVDDAIGDWVLAGGSISKAPHETEWGGYSGYVADPDGNLWELAHNPGWPLDERGLPQLGAEMS